MKILLLSLLLAVATHRSLLAQNVPAPPSTAVVPTVPNPAPAAPGPAAPLSYCAYVDAYCGYDFGNDGSNVRPSFLYSHNGQNEFSINQGVVGARYDNGLNFNADNDSLNLDYAPNANVLLRVEERHLRGQTPVLQRPNNPTANSYGNLTSSLAISF